MIYGVHLLSIFFSLVYLLALTAKACSPLKKTYFIIINPMHVNLDKQDVQNHNKTRTTCITA